MIDAIGLDVGVTYVKAVCVTARGDVVARASFETGADSPDWPTRVRDNLAALEREHGRAARVGLSAPGVAAADGSRIRWMRGRLSEVEGLDWSAFLGRPVPVLNDAQAALLGEAWQGAARGAQNAMLLTLGTGVGGAAMVDGRLLRGHLGRAGHLGHVTVDYRGQPDIVNTPGSLEAHIGNYTIGQRSGGRFPTTHALLAAAQSGDASARPVWDESLRALAAAMASLVNVLDPEVVIVGGGIAAAGDALLEPLERLYRPMEWRLNAGPGVRIALATLGEYAGAIGAARNALEHAAP